MTAGGIIRGDLPIDRHQVCGSKAYKMNLARTGDTLIEALIVNKRPIE